jgi:lambda repressor-like predicted transcriptional regulator
MHPENIKMQLKKRGIKQTDIARELEITPSSVVRVIDGTGKSIRVAQLISEKLQRPISQVFPRQYKNEAINKLAAASDKT